MILDNATFGLRHIIVLIICIAVLVLIGIFAKKFTLNFCIKFLMYIGIFSEVTKVFYYIMHNESTLHGYLAKTDLPFHLCSIQLIFIAILNFSKNDGFKKLIMSFMLPTCLIGGIAAILLPTYSARNAWPITIQYFSYHVAIAGFSIFLLRTKEIKFTIKDYFNCLKLLGLMGMMAIYINGALYDGVNTSINFMYVVSPPQDGLPFLTKEYGWLVYFVHYAALAVFSVTMVYIMPIIHAIKEKIENKKASC